jgi:hypothetical protein
VSVLGCGTWNAFAALPPTDVAVPACTLGYTALWLGVRVAPPVLISTIACPELFKLKEVIGFARLASRRQIVRSSFDMQMAQTILPIPLLAESLAPVQLELSETIATAERHGANDPSPTG